MDRDNWTVLRAAVIACARELRAPARRFEFSDTLIVLMWLWAAMHERPLCWACQRSSYGALMRPPRLPSVSQFCKRLHSFRFGRLRVLLHRRLTAAGRGELLGFFDGMAMPVRDHSTDAQARAGAAGRHKVRRGYKLHARAAQGRGGRGPAAGRRGL